jgi:hypothetical protein
MCSIASLTAAGGRLFGGHHEYDLAHQAREHAGFGGEQQRRTVEYDHAVRIAAGQFLDQAAHGVAGQQFRGTLVQQACRNDPQVRDVGVQQTSSMPMSSRSSTSIRPGRSFGTPNSPPALALAMSPSTSSTVRSSSMLMLMARLIDVKVLPSPCSELVTMIRLGLLDLGRALALDVGEQRALDHAVLFRDAAAGPIGRDHAHAVQPIQRNVDDIRRLLRGRRSSPAQRAPLPLRLVALPPGGRGPARQTRRPAPDFRVFRSLFR